MNEQVYEMKMIGNMRNTIIWLFFLMLAVSCQEGPDMPMQSLTLDQDVIVAPSMGADYDVKVGSNTAWKVRWSSVDWIVPSVTEFVGSSGFVLDVAANDGEERTGCIAVETSDGSISRDITVVQAGVKSDGFISVSALRQMEKTGEKVTVEAAGTRIKGFVVTDSESGNWPSGSFAVEDSFSQPYSGITVFFDGEYEAFACGEEVSVELENAMLGRNVDGFLVLSPATVPSRTESTPINVKPHMINFADLADGLYESMLVKLDGFQVTSDYLGGTLGASPLFENEDADNLRLMVGEEAAFAVESYREGAGTVAGIAGGAAAVPGIWPMRKSDVALSDMRIGVKAGIRKLPYVFSFYCKEQTNKTPKYIDWFNLSYNASSKLLQGVIARDSDETKGVSLEVTAYGSDASKIYGPNFWAEAGAHDNLNTSGFVSLDCKTVPTAECGWLLNVPLQMEMPKDFNVSFGLTANNKYTLGEWAVFWSCDKSDWQEAGRIVILKPKAGGSNYWYFTVPVSLPASLPAGSMLYIKLVPQGSDGTDGYKGADGHGSSCYVCLHSAIILSHEQSGDTPVPSGAVYFEPFDNLVAGMDYFIGDRLGGLANYCAGEISSWPAEKSRGMSGSKVMERPGYAQIGFVNTESASSRTVYVNEKGSLLTPALGRSGDFSLSFKACAYRTPAIRPNASASTPDVGRPDITSAVVEIIGGGTVNGNTLATVSGLPVDSFRTFSLNIVGATENTQIKFTSAPADGEFSRWFIDDILVSE